MHRIRIGCAGKGNDNRLHVHYGERDNMLIPWQIGGTETMTNAWGGTKPLEIGYDDAKAGGKVVLWRFI